MKGIEDSWNWIKEWMRSKKDMIQIKICSFKKELQNGVVARTEQVNLRNTFLFVFDYDLF